MWIMLAPSSTARRASAAYSDGVYGIAGHWSRFATAPEMAQVSRTGSSTAIDPSGSGTCHCSLCRTPCRPARHWSARLRVHPSVEGTNRKDPSYMLGNIIAAIVIGIIAGYLGRLLLPGKDPMGFVGTVIAGILGAIVGYFIFTSLLGIGDDDKFDLGGIVGSIVGVMIVLLVLRAVGGRGRGRGTTTRGPAV